MASALASIYALGIDEVGRAIESECALSFTEAIQKLLDFSMSFNRKHPEFHSLVFDAPLSAARDEEQSFGQAFVDFIAARHRRQVPKISRSEAAHHGQLALMIFRGILQELTTATPSARPRPQHAMSNAVLRYLEPVLTETKMALPRSSQS